MSTDPASRRRARRQRVLPTVAQTGGQNTDPLTAAMHSASARPSAHQLLGVRPDASRLQVVKGYQRALRAATDDHSRRQLAAAFRKLGAQPLRVRCPYGHDLIIYALDGDTHTAYCADCYTEGRAPTSHPYIGWARCLNVQRAPGAELDGDDLPPGSDPVATTDVRVSYRTPVEDRHLTFTMAAAVPLWLGPGDFFSVLMRAQQPWRLLNHSSAMTFPLDPLHTHRKELERMEASARARADAQALRSRQPRPDRPPRSENPLSRGQAGR